MVALTNLLQLALIGFASAAPVTTTATTTTSTSFSGTGQLRTQWSSGDYADLGCLTDSGEWTANDDICGQFTAVRPSQNQFTLTSRDGPCQYYGARFTCGPGNAQYTFGTWPFANSIPGVECLRWGLYGIMASWEKNPPDPSDAPEEIHLADYTEQGKYVWATWRPLTSTS
ncbi:hypothetical protein QBC46DRAFT_259682 [Diplogelasinospora grovesii]|uniref:RNase T2-like C-terminal domain-containing protein n=1 Tax=Diplogelasinospora grovesii TaxID=303347 RepID=A0AAN6N890_9PEZI|nr:hypothetical protein QBC46DRAFT_259682 [Diplogelasinospora grovesii]